MSTPRTDAVACWPASTDDSDQMTPQGGYVPAEFARTLETELAACRGELARQLIYADGFPNESRCALIDHLRDLETPLDTSRL